MKKSIIDILEDDEKLKAYVETLEKDLASCEDLDEKVDLVLNNILANFNDFKDRKSLRASNIDAITNLLKFKSELPMKRIQTKKIILDILSRKKELEIKAKTADANAQLSGSAADILNAIFYKMDLENIHPNIDDNLMEHEEYKEIIDIVSVETIESEKEEETVSKNNETVDIVEIQRQLEEERIKGYKAELEEIGDDEDN